MKLTNTISSMALDGSDSILIAGGIEGICISMHAIINYICNLIRQKFNIVTKSYSLGTLIVWAIKDYCTCKENTSSPQSMFLALREFT